VYVVVVVNWTFSNVQSSWFQSNPQIHPISYHFYPLHHLWCSRCLHSLLRVAFIRLKHDYLALHEPAVSEAFVGCP